MLRHKTARYLYFFTMSMVLCFGTPNAINGNPDYIYQHIYELPTEEGQPRYLEVHGDHEIYSVSVHDDLNWLYVLWQKDE